jgi:signal transduction histidine kinase
MIKGYAIIIVVMIAVNIYELYELDLVSYAAQTTLTSNVRAINLAKQLQNTLYEEERNGQKFRISRDYAYYGLFCDDTVRFASTLDSLRQLSLAATETQLIEQLGTRHAWVVTAVVHEKDSPQVVSAERGLLGGGAWIDSIGMIHSTLTEFVRQNQLSIADAMNNFEATTRRSSQVALLLTIIGVVLAATTAFFITRTITRPIRTLIRGTQQIARGEFAPIHVKSHDEVALLAAAFNDMSNQLNKINELKEEMMQQIAHELRTPLATMLTAHYLLSDDSEEALTPRQQRLLTTIRNGIDKLTAFSHDFLDLSRIEAGMMEYHFEPTDLTALVKPLVDEAALTASAKGVTLDFASNGAPEVNTDKERFSQAVSNLLSNAIKYTEPGGTVTVVVSQSETGARVAVQDTGVGIPSEDLPKVFTKFYRVQSPRGGKARGSGVGLALVQAVVDAHGGKVYVTSTPGVGSTFSIELPTPPAHKADVRTHIEDTGQKAMS